MKKGLKILELTHYSAGVCGVWARVLEESKGFVKKGHKVRVFSTNKTKGSDEIAQAVEKKDDILIQRFPGLKLGGESFMNWRFEEAAMKYRPDIIIAHSYRHLHTLKALRVAKKIGAKVFLVTHAPFVSGNETRSWLSKFAVEGFDIFLGGRTLNEFDKVIAITKWEVPHLMRLGLGNDKISYIPNGVPKKFFSLAKGKEEKGKILFLGRISPIKDLETLLKACQLLKRRGIEFDLEIVGPAERAYLSILNKLIRRLGIEDKVKFSPAVFDIKSKIRKLDSAMAFVLPSKREAMPQSLIEAMAREKFVVASDNWGARDLIENGKNGCLFSVGNSEMLADCLERGFKLDKKGLSKIGKAARKSVEKFEWGEVMKAWDKVLKD